MKLLLSALILLGGWSPSWAQGRNPPPPTTRTKDGLIITPIVLPVNDVAAMLNIAMWRFKIQPTVPTPMLNYRLELRRPGQEPIEMHKGGSGPLNEEEFTFGLMPLGEETFNNAEKLQVYYREQPLDPASLTLGGGGQGKCGNPIRDLKSSSSSSTGGSGSWANVNDDGSIILMDFNEKEGKKPNKSYLVLVLTAEKPPEPAKP